jgi:signal peptidase II
MISAGWSAQRPYAALVAVLVALDQITKRLVDTSMELHESRPILEGCLSLTYVRNRGAAFGLLSGADLPHQALLLTLLSVAALLAIGLYTLRLSAEERLARSALTLILAGALGNLICRVRFGYVIDFVDVYWGLHHWPAFNLADSAISIGVCLLVLDMLRAPQPAVAAAPSAEALPSSRSKD